MSNKSIFLVLRAPLLLYAAVCAMLTFASGESGDDRSVLRMVCQAWRLRLCITSCLPRGRSARTHPFWTIAAESGGKPWSSPGGFGRGTWRTCTDVLGCAGTWREDGDDGLWTVGKIVRDALFRHQAIMQTSLVSSSTEVWNSLICRLAQGIISICLVATRLSTLQACNL